MRTSRWTAFLIAPLLLLSACTKPDKKDPSGKEKPAPFRVETGSVKGWADQVLAQDAWQKPLGSIFQFTACVKDRARDTKLLGQTFAVVDVTTNREVERRMTTPEGCVVWTEMIPFNYFAKRSRWVTIERDLVGQGVYSGRRRVTFAVNPWLASGRKEMEPGQAGYFLRDDPLELTDAKTRLEKIQEFFAGPQATNQAGQKISAAEASMLSQWVQQLENQYAEVGSPLANMQTTDAALRGEEGAAEIWVRQIDVLSTKTSNLKVEDENSEVGMIVKQTIEMEPRLRVRYANGASEFEDLNHGDFDMYIQVVATETGDDQKRKVILSSSLNAVAHEEYEEDGSPKGVGRIVDGKLIGYVTFKVSRDVSEANLQYVVKLVPRGIGTRSPKIFEGIFNMGKKSNWAEGKTDGKIVDFCVPEVGPTLGCSYEKYLATTDKYDVLRANFEAHRADPYRFTNIRARFILVDTGRLTTDPAGRTVPIVGETATQRRVLYSASTCITNSAGERMIRQKFIVNYLDVDDSGGTMGPLEPIVTNDDGCLFWNNQINHGYYKKEKYFRQRVAIEGPGGFKRFITFYINPWDDKFLFGFDEEEFGRELYEKSVKRKRIDSLFFLGDYGYNTIRFAYAIDKYMDLEVKKTVTVTLAPQVLRYSGLSGGRKVTEYLRDGIYLLRIGIQKSYLDPADKFNRLCTVKRERRIDEANGDIKLREEPAVINNSDICSLPKSERDALKISYNEQQTDEGKKKAGFSTDKFTDNVVTKEFITTKSALVRVTDGLIVYPIEMTMRDLRLMRVRASILMQLEPVDETKVLWYDGSSKAQQAYVYNVITERRKQKEAFRRGLDKLDDDKKSEAIEQNDLALEAKVKSMTKFLGDLYTREISRINTTPGPIISDLNREESEFTAFVKRVQAHPESLEQMLDGMNPEDRQKFEQFAARYDLYNKVAINDFTSTGLPTCNRSNNNCDDFVEPMETSGLQKRTFVGPVIFLSNSVKDAVRPTDNLDEAACKEQIEGIDYRIENMDDFEAKMLHKENTLFEKSLNLVETNRTNLAYRHDKYFGSLRQFCVRPIAGAENKWPKVEFYPKQVSDLVKEEAELKLQYSKRMEALATPYNFAGVFNLDFVSLGNEQLKKFDDSLVAKTGCLKEEGDVQDCMVPTDERSISTHELISRSNAYSEEMGNAFYRVSEKNKDEFAYDIRKIKHSVYGESDSLEDRGIICALLANGAMAQFKKMYPRDSGAEADGVRETAYANCIIANPKSAFSRDRRLRILETGDYVFKGGMQLNFNVGTNFSLSRSTGLSAGIDFLDVADRAAIGIGMAAGWAIGGPLGAGIGGLIGWFGKPLDFKRGFSLSGSKGTSVSEGTYLVAQMAKFMIPLKKWEECRVIRLHPATMRRIAGSFGLDLTRSDEMDISTYLFSSADWPVDMVRGGRQLKSRLSMVDPIPEDDEPALNNNLNLIFGRGLFVCEGDVRMGPYTRQGSREGMEVEEHYFYFTQHFTEGDMLDQADLYNHPWLLSLRGVRDFQAFVSLIHGQEIPSIDKFVDGLGGGSDYADKTGAPLAHMADVYKRILPSFPGFYTLLAEDEEKMDYFPLKSRPFSYADFDINSEVDRPVLNREPVVRPPVSAAP